MPLLLSRNRTNAPSVLCGTIGHVSESTSATPPTPIPVAGGAKRKNRKRTRSATIARRLHAKARERQGLWLEQLAPGEDPTGRANETERLRRALDEGFKKLRDVRFYDHDLAPGNGLEGAPINRITPGRQYE